VERARSRRDPLDARSGRRLPQLVRRRTRRGSGSGARAHRGHLPQQPRHHLPRTPPLRRDGLVVNEWTATATRDGRKLEWDGIDVFPIEDGKIKRKDVYSGYGVAREIGSSLP
jgi:hypothetical protein